MRFVPIMRLAAATLVLGTLLSLRPSAPSLVQCPGACTAGGDFFDTPTFCAANRNVQVTLGGTSVAGTCPAAAPCDVNACQNNKTVTLSVVAGNAKLNGSGATCTNAHTWGPTQALACGGAGQDFPVDIHDGGNCSAPATCSGIVHFTCHSCATAPPGG